MGSTMSRRRGARMRVGAVIAATAAVALGGLLVGCSSSSRSSTSASKADSAPAEASSGASSGAQASPTTVPSGAAGGSSALDAAPAETGRKVVSTATLKVGTDDVADAKARAAGVVKDAGGFVYAEQSQYDSTAQVTVTYKVPPDRFDGVLAALASIGTLQSQDIATDDVTAKVVDLDARIQAAEASTARLRGLYDKAGSVTELTSLEREVATREGELESLRGQARTLDKQVELATVKLTLTARVATPGAQRQADTSPPGFASGLAAGWAAFVGVVGWAATIAGATAPFLVAAAVVVLPLTWLLARRRRRAATTSAGPAT
ncbi:MAG: DUF4349 domain-containing protein [Acidimicrobiales bacterium]